MRRAFVLSATALVALLWSGCEAQQQTEYVAAVSTQVRVPRDLRHIRVAVSSGGVITFCRGYRSYDGRVLLPRSLGTFPRDPNNAEPVTYSIIGYTAPLEEGTEFDLERCSDRVTGDVKDARILKRSRQPYIKDEILFLPLPLKYSCFDKACNGDGQTCRGGRCVDATLANPEGLPKYLPELVDGSGSSCFSAATCLGGAVPAIVVNEDDCTYAVPNSASQPPLVQGAPDPFPGLPPGEGVNVEVVYDGGYVKEILDKDPEDGFFIPDPAKPQQFRLAPGLCDLVKGSGPDGETSHRITAVRTSGLCRSKIATQPLCASDQQSAMGVDSNGVAPSTTDELCKPLELKPPKAALMVVIDDTVKHAAFHKEAGAATVAVPLKDPAFARTDLGLFYAPGKTQGGTPRGCGDTFAPEVAPGPAFETRTLLDASLKAREPVPPGSDNVSPLLVAQESPFLDGVLRDVYATLSTPTYATYFRTAVAVLGNRRFDESNCGELASQRAQAAAQTIPPGHAAPIQTYVIQLARDPDDFFAPTPEPGAFALAAAGGTGFPSDARENKEPAFQKFREIVNSLATCVYDVPAGFDPTKTVLTYFNPTDITPAALHKIGHDPACNTENAPASGFGVDPNNPSRLYVCGQACTDYRNVLSAASTFNGLYGKPAPAVPIFAHHVECAP